MTEQTEFLIAPLAAYKKPGYPTHEDARLDPVLLKRIPSRWRKNMAALACLGLLGASVLTGLGGCNWRIPPPIGGGSGGNGGNYTYNGNENGSNHDYNGNDNNGDHNYNENGNGNNGNENNGNGNTSDLCIRHIVASGLATHFGGSGGPPAYIVYLTEQEALDVIRYKADRLGLPLKSDVPSVYVNTSLDSDWWGGSQRQVNLGLFNEQKNIGIAHVGGSNSWWGPSNSEVAQNAQELFDEKDSDMIVAVTHGASEVGTNYYGVHGSGLPNSIPPTLEQKIEITQQLKTHLKAQVREFIEWLQAEGIIQ